MGRLALKANNREFGSTLGRWAQLHQHLKKLQGLTSYLVYVCVGMSICVSEYVYVCVCVCIGVCVCKCVYRHVCIVSRRVCICVHKSVYVHRRVCI